ncbi:MerR family transcriptional regulator [Kineosporia sp. NBRC 101731]|uniref:MerR family transcriptional regulator n=1 Tax=Kineosporia sp. NBRC 101731 TaxID=3032199 RepID=UPI0024A17508|nr:MerR family transcriptional regulator [Kineosporia sp. NBRC 101731]GLY29013.1 MerR family transcriptional regulator [Kineosporia sp. NBRC 101731]
MTATMTIGDFSRATRLSAKALRLYHQAGLLEPARVDPHNGYRLYSADQICDARLIRHLRSLEMPVDVVRDVLGAPSRAGRNAIIAAHLSEMEARLEQVRMTVASLRSLLTGPEAPIEVTRRRVAAEPAVVVREIIDLADLSDWYIAATGELEQAIAAGRVRATGPMGGLWDSELFLDERGEAVLFVPVATLPEPELPGRLRAELMPAVELAVAVHRGPDETIGEVHAALGEYVARHGIAADGPVREWYLDTSDEGVTEIGWPISPPD